MSSDGFDEAACLRRVRERYEAACRELVEHLDRAVTRIVRAHLPRRDAEEESLEDSAAFDGDPGGKIETDRGSDRERAAQLARERFAADR